MKILNNFDGQTQSANGNHISYAGWVEAGVYFGRYLVGAEVGYQNIDLESTNNLGNKAKFDASGFYGKLMAGISFF